MSDFKLDLGMNLKTFLVGMETFSKEVVTKVDAAKAVVSELFNPVKASAGQSVSAVTSIQTAVTSLASQAKTALAEVFVPAVKGADTFKQKVDEARDKLSGLASYFTELFGESGAIASKDAGIAKRFKKEFGEGTEAAEAFAVKTSNALARSRPEIESYLTQLSFVAKNMGLGRDAAQVLSKELVTIGFDLAAAKGIDAAEAMNVLQGALVGNVRALRQFGISISDTAEQEEALKRGLDPSKLTEQESATIRLSIVTEKLAEVKGAAAEASGGLGAAQRTLTNEMEALKAAIGKAYNEAIGPIVKWAANAAKAIHEWADAHPVLAKGITSTVVALGGMVTAVAAGITTILASMKVYQTFKLAIEGVNAAKAALTTIVGSLAEKMNIAGAAAANAGTAMASAANAAIWLAVAAAIGQVVAGMIDARTEAQSILDYSDINDKTFQTALEHLKENSAQQKIYNQLIAEGKSQREAFEKATSGFDTESAKRAGVLAEAVKYLKEQEKALAETSEFAAKELALALYGQTEAQIADLRSSNEKRMVMLRKAAEDELLLIKDAEKQKQELRKKGMDSTGVRDAVAALDNQGRARQAALKKIEDDEIALESAFSARLQELYKKRIDDIIEAAQKQADAVHQQTDSVVKEYERQGAQIRGELDKIKAAQLAANQGAYNFWKTQEDAATRARNPILAETQAIVENGQAVLQAGASAEYARAAKLKTIEAINASIEASKKEVEQKKKAAEDALDNLGQARLGKQDDPETYNAALQERKKAVDDLNRSEANLAELKSKAAGFQAATNAWEERSVAIATERAKKADELQKADDQNNKNIASANQREAEELSKIDGLKNKLIDAAKARLGIENDINAALETQNKILADRAKSVYVPPSVQASDPDGAEYYKRKMAERELAPSVQDGIQTQKDTKAGNGSVNLDFKTSLDTGASVLPEVAGDFDSNNAAQGDANALLKQFGDVVTSGLAESRTAFKEQAQILTSLISRAKAFDILQAAQVDLGGMGLGA